MLAEWLVIIQFALLKLLSVDTFSPGDEPYMLLADPLGYPIAQFIYSCDVHNMFQIRQNFCCLEPPMVPHGRVTPVVGRGGSRPKFRFIGSLKRLVVPHGT